MKSEHRDLLRRALQAEEAWRREGGEQVAFRLQHVGGMGREIDHPGWDPSWSVPTEHTIDDLEELDLLRVEPSSNKTRTFVLTMKGRAQAEAAQAQPPVTPPSGGRAPAANEVLRWLAEVERDAPECFDLPKRLLDRATAEHFIEAPAREPLARRILDLLSEGYLSGQVFDWDQATREQALSRTQDLALTIKGHEASNSGRVTPPATTPAPGHTEPGEVRDVFISHAGADKDAVARPLARALQARGYSVWFDEFELVVGDRLSSSIDQGLATSRCGVVVLSQAFMARPWPQRELSGLVARETATGELLVLPVWHGVGRDEVRAFSPPLADVLAVETTAGLDAVVDALAPAIERRRGQEQLAGRALAAVDVEATPAGRRTLDDDALLAFDAGGLAEFSEATARRALTEHGDVYRSQLVTALWLDGWRRRMADHDWAEESAAEAFDYAIREVAAHLRQGDFLPGGFFHREATEGSADG